MTTPFTQFAFASTGSTANRTLPDRLAQIKNVKDFGAAGDGVTDDWAAIDAAWRWGQFTLTTTAPTAAGDQVLTFASVPASFTAPSIYGYAAEDLTNPTSIWPTNQIIGATSTTITMNTGASATINVGEVIAFNPMNRGIIFFPPGTYKVLQPINYFGSGNTNTRWMGVGAASIITGDFADYVFRRTFPPQYSDPGGVAFWGGIHTVENLQIINTNANGGGIRHASVMGAAIRNCIITANRAINNSIGDNVYVGIGIGDAAEYSIENCSLSPGAHRSGSIGIFQTPEGPIWNCYLNGFERGIITGAGEGGMVIQGCRFELCDTGLRPSMDPAGNTGVAAGGMTISGCHFKNCGTAIYGLYSSRFEGILIEGTNGTLPGGTNPQYGIRMDYGQEAGILMGVVVTGQYDQAGIYIQGGDVQNPAYGSFYGVVSTNSGSGVGWNITGAPVWTEFIACNTSPIYTMAQLPLYYLTGVTATWSAGVATLTFAAGAKGGLTSTYNIIVSGVSVAGYNGTFAASASGVFSLSYPVAGPLANGSGGTVLAVGANKAQLLPNLWEGDCYNVSDSASAWGADAGRGGGSTHAKVRFNGTNFTVIGK